jgi:RHS repeat-associated protein
MRKIYLLTLLCAFTFATSLLAQNVGYTSLFDNASFSAKAIIQSLPVGSTPGAGNVSGNGGSSYSIPIAVPPGTNGVVPSVSIEYNSQGGSGIAGMGWNISGLSAITRVPKNVYYDGSAGPVDLSTNDRFAFDGTRLISKAGTYGAAGSTYGTEVENFSTITAIGTLGGGPLSFEVLTKDGVKMEFGNTTDSRFMSQTGNTVMFWRLNRLRYPDGNYVDFTYTDTSAERDSRISEIRYTGNTITGQTAYNKIEFGYKVRQEASPGTFSDVRTTYEAGSSMLSKYLLDLITVKAEGTIVKKYQFGYGHDNINSYLKSVTEYGSDNSQLNPTIFKYGDTPVLRTSGSTSILAGNDIMAFSGDYDGDGKDDILSAHVSSTNDGIDYVDNFKIFKANVAGTSYAQTASVNLPFNFTVFKRNGQKYSIPNSQNLLTNDFTGDGVDDVLTLNIVPTSTTESRLANVTIYESTNGGTSFVPHARSVQPNYDRIHASKKFFYPGDFDGDGITEYITILGNSVGSYQPFLCSNYLSGGVCGAVSITGPTNFPVGSWVDANRIDILDFDGDGKQDIMFIGGSLTEVFTLQGYNAARIYSGSSFTTASGDLFFADFNGDNKTDILEVSADLSAFKKWVSTGKAFVQSNIDISSTKAKWPSPINPEYDENVVVIGDYNGDGKSDIFVRWARAKTTILSDGSTQVERRSGENLYYSNNDAFTYKEVKYDVLTYILGPTQGRGVTTIYDFPTDLNGDSRTDLVSTVGGVFSYLIFNKDGTDNLLHKVSNGLNHVTEWNYKSLVGNDTFYVKGSGTSVYPFNNVQPAAVLVSDFKVPNGVGGTSSVQYSYEDARLHRAGKGFLGFKNVYATDITIGIKTVTESEFNTTYYASVPYRTITYLTSNSSLLSTTTLTNAFVSPAAKRFWVKTPELLESSNLTGGSIKTTSTYDDTNGNITYSKMDVNGGLEVTETTTAYGAFPGSIANKPVSVTIAKTRNGQAPSYSVVTTFGYNAIGQLTSKTNFSGTAKSVATSYSYNTLGNLTSTTVTPSGMTARTSSSTFDSKGRYPESSFNVSNQGSSASYDTKWGKPLSTTGIDGLTTSSTYDGFGRTTTTTYPGPYTTNQTYVWDNSNGAVWRSDQTYPGQGKPDSKIWFDLLGRQIRTETEGFGGTIIQAQTYDAKGNIKTSTQPYKSGETYITTTNGYHPNYNWLVSVDKGALGATSMGYNYSAGALTLTTTAPTGTNSKTTDASGKVTSATDNGGTLTYSYYNHGGLKEVKKDNVILTSSEYDAYGMQTKLTDANAGVTTYDYDALGQLTTQVNANGKTHTMAYNLLGQVTTRTGPEGTTSYIYGSSNSGGESKNQVKQITGFTSGNQSNYTYDALGRATSVIEKIDGTDHTTSYSYNSFGDVVNTTYPSTLVVTNVYDTNGYLSKIQSGGSDIYTTSTMNGQGQVMAYSLGNGKSSANTYVNGFPTKFETAGIQNLNMGWDYQKGNLTSRNDARTAVNKTESFTYDNLNRLTGSTISGIAGSFTTTYGSNGNISTKTDAGTYSYDATKFNAVTGVTNPAPASPIPLMQQDISYTAFMQPFVVTEKDAAGVTNELTYTYGADYERIKGVLKSGTTMVNTRYYFAGGFEKEVTGSGTRYVQYIASPAGLSAIIVSNAGGPHVIHYTYTDHLGSIVTVTNGTGTVEAQQSFDAWGRRRVFDSWTLLGPTAAVPNIQDWLYRGYTGHEHLDRFGLINMNGRMYDPVLGRMLSPDNFVQEPGMTQSFNRYSYVMNNPLLNTDPDGQWWFIIPQISFGKGGFSLGLEVGVGIPGVLSASVTGGYNFKNNAGYWSIQGFAVGLYSGYGSSGAFAGYGYRYAGFSAGIGYGSSGWNAGISYGGTSGNFNGALGFGWSEKGGFDWNVNGGYTHNFLVTRGVPDNLTANLENSFGYGGEKNVPGGEWDFWGEGVVPYQGDAMGGTNFIGPGPDRDPYKIPDPRNPGRFLTPIDQIDKAAQLHDAAYFKARTGGIKGAFFNEAVTIADAMLALRANKIITQHAFGNVAISQRTANLAQATFAAFAAITVQKAIRPTTYIR